MLKTMMKIVPLLFVIHLQQTKKIKRNKLISIAKKSEAGWLTIEENQNDSMESDSDNSQKVRQTKQKSLQKQKKSSVRSKFFFPFPENVLSQHYRNASFI